MSADAEMVGFVGSIRSTQVNAVAPDVLKVGKPFMIGGTDPTLTHMGNRWLFRTRPNDSYSAKVIAQFGVKELKKLKWAVVNSTDAFGSNGAKQLLASLKALDVEPVLVQGYTNQQSDFTPVCLAVRSSGADVPRDVFHLRDGFGGVRPAIAPIGRDDPLGSAPPPIVNISALNLGGRSLFGTYGVADFAVDSSPEAKAYAAKYEAKMKTPPDNQSSYAYDAITILGNAINTAGTTEPEKIRSAILAIRGFKGAEGEYNFERKRRRAARLQRRAPTRTARSSTTAVSTSQPDPLTIFLQLLFTGLGIGSIYALVSLGFVLLIRAASVVNFAQGEFSMLGAYFMVILANDLGVPYFVAIPDRDRGDVRVRVCVCRRRLLAAAPPGGNCR